MKGRTTCPECKYEFLLDVSDNVEKHEVECPQCNNKFVIKPKSPNSGSDDDFSWEEHGEPRKTILSSIKIKTNRPMIAAFSLICVFIIGITTAAFSEVFIESSMSLATDIGITGSVEIKVIDQSNNTLPNINIKINSISKTTNKNGLFSAENVELGIQTLELSGEGYKTEIQKILVTPLFISESTIKMTAGDGKGKTANFDTTGCAFILAIFSVFALLGTLTCLKRRYIDAAIASCILGIFSFGFFFIGSLLCIFAFALILKSREEFENGKKGKIF